jgi:HEPN domain
MLRVKKASRVQGPSSEVDEILTAENAPQETVTTDGYIQYGDIAYLSCRILMLASMAVHPEALYCASQTIEKYMKAILISRAESVRGRGHDLVRLSRALQGEFLDSQFVLICERLAPFEEAGRYPDNTVPAWEYDLSLLTFLDGFVVHARAAAGMSPGCINLVKYLLTQDASGNPVLAAAVQAVREQNRHIAELLTPGYLPSDSRG